MPTLFEDFKTKVKLKFKPKINTSKLLKEHELQLEEVQFGGEIDHTFDETTSMNIQGKFTVTDKDIVVDKASIMFTKKF